ncbi:MAG: hypothetical protein Dasosvirus15_6 [Dasosvirus sp.]|uniref:Uncharacterized protein n=1 Tax=Dasosvirus sp. TaxID=2487764 RepID=A0A3G4ZVI7_9VIRU|nr:MAG: hypothetical protein Dasosvirus15_6 [Dasosvirus sp.]
MAKYLNFYDDLFQRLNIDYGKSISLNICTEDRDFYYPYYCKSKSCSIQQGGGSKNKI